MTTFTWDTANPLTLCKGETRKSNTALNDYWLMGDGRSLSKLNRSYIKKGGSIPTKHLQTLREWSAKYAWQARINRAKSIEDERQRALWRDRQDEWRRKEWEVAQKFSDKVVAMLNHQITEETWRASDAPRMMDVASKLARLAAAMAEVTAPQTTINIDVTSLTDAQLERALSGEDILSVISDTSKDSDDNDA